MKKEEQFRQLHHNGKILILPNIWDPFGALLLEKLGYPAVATASSSVALSNGYGDGEKLPFDALLHLLKEIVKRVQVPVTADVESGYAGDNHHVLAENIKKLIDTGIAGINFEDSVHGKPGMTSLEEQTAKISLIKKTASTSGSQLFINARVDVYIKRAELNDDEKLSEAIKRGKAYKDSGADGLYPIILRNEKHIDALVKEVGLPLNLTMIPGIPPMDILKKMGVARLSLASGFFKAAVSTMKGLAEDLLNGRDVTAVMKKTVTSEFFEGLIEPRG